MSALRGLLRGSRRPPVARIAFNMAPVPGPWGGSSAFVGQMAGYLERRGYAVRFDLAGNPDVVVIVDPREDNRHKKFGLRQIEEARKADPRLRVLHRVNECDMRKGTDFMDRMLADANRLADFTVFISSWLCEHHAERWFNRGRPHLSIYNGADPAVFHPVGSATWRSGDPLRVVTHHWSANPLKGFAEYEQCDRLIADGELPGFQLVVIGRWPETVRWRSAECHLPASGHALADQLRGCHLYLTASRWEPCGMHHVEGAQCGLPLVCHADGGGIVEAGERYGVVFRDDLRGALQDARARYAVLRERALAAMPDGERMCWEYEGVIRGLLMGRA